MKLLTRNVFRETVLARDNHKCCVPDCNSVAVDAHHIFNRNLFVELTEQGGYFYDNGAQLCSEHHYQAEATVITVEQLQEWCNVQKCFPSTLDSLKQYDCWGNEIVENGFRKQGLLFNNEGFQKLAKRHNILWLFN